MVPMGFELGRIHLLVYQWDAWLHSPRELFLLAPILWPRTIPERIFFEQLTHRSLLFENSDKGEKKGEFEKSWSTRNSYVRSHI
jgi:hypothetical protein